MPVLAASPAAPAGWTWFHWASPSVGRLNHEHVAAECDDVEVARLVLAEAGDAAQASGVGGECGVAVGEAAARLRRSGDEACGRDRPDVVADEVGEYVESLQRLDWSAVDKSAGQRVALERPAAVAILGHRHRQ